MSFRTRLLLGAIPLALLPLLLLALGVRREVERRMTRQYDDRVAAMAALVEEDLDRESRAIGSRLHALAATLAADNRFRLALVDAGADRRYLLDYAGAAMALAGLDALQIQDERGRILSSGHFRNEFDRVDAALPAALRATPDTLALAELRSPGGALPALVRLADVRLGARTLTLVGGAAVDRRFLARLDRGAGLSVALVHPGGTVRPAGGTGAVPRDDVRVREVVLPFVGAGGERGDASFQVAQSLAPLRELRSSIDRWFAVATAAAAALAVLLALTLAARLSRPLAELALRTRRLDLDRLDVDFPSWRADEIGVLARTLGALTQRLRASAARLRDAERRATLGDVARQVNHDVRNGLTPIRNVVQHLAQLARERPAELPEVFLERQSTLDASIGYLHSLAASYARLSPQLERRACDVNAIVRDVVNAAPEAEGGRVLADLAAGLPAVIGDPVALRRIIENLATNALESLAAGKGTVVISTSRAETHGEARVHLVVADTGPGMTAEQAGRVFDDFYTTKERGTGLGLSIVRRLVTDMGGVITVDTEPGRGARFRIDLPAAAAAPPEREHDGHAIATLPTTAAGRGSAS
jgi:signal transduction histidine kinase